MDVVRGGVHRSTSLPAALAKRENEGCRTAPNGSETTLDHSSRVNLIEARLSFPLHASDAHLRAEPLLCVMVCKAVVVSLRAQLSSVGLRVHHGRNCD